MTRFDPIGEIATPFDSHEDAPKQGSNTHEIGVITIKSAYGDGLCGIETGQSIEIVWFADRANRDRLVFDRNGSRGVFSTRSQDRPNPICVTRSMIVDIDRPHLTVEGIDMLDGTPILDLKGTMA